MQDPHPVSRVSHTRFMPSWVWVERALLVAVGLLFWIVWIDPPQPPNANLDPSWQSVLSDAHVHGRLFGKEILFTHGAWGWLASHFHVPASLHGKWCWEFFGKLAFTAILVTLTLDWPTWRRWVFLATILLFTQFFPDTIWMVLITLVVVQWLFEPDLPSWALAILLTAFGLLAHMKFSFVLFTWGGVGTAAISLGWRRHWPRAGLLIGGFAAACVAWWLAAGQNLTLLPDAWRLGLELADGYSSAMIWQEPARVFWAAILTSGLAATFFVRSLRFSKDRPRDWPLLAFGAAIWFLAWKHGFTRADGHVLGFFSAAVFLGVALPAALHHNRCLSWMDAAAICGLAGFALSNWGFFTHAPIMAKAHVARGVAYALHPGRAEEEFLRLWVIQQKSAHIPETGELVGQASIDVLGYSQATALLNRFNYAPRPVFQSYSAYTPTLLRRNWRYFLSDRAPEYVLVDYATIDGRFPTQDDSLVLAELRRRYEPVTQTANPILLRRKAEQPKDREFRRDIVFERTLAFGEEVSLPEAGACAQWLQVWIEPTLLGRARRLLYRPPVILMTVVDSEGRSARKRLIPGIAEEGFIVRPFIEDRGDAAAFFRGEGAKWLQTVKFEPEIPDEGEFLRRVRIRVSNLADIPIAAEDPMLRHVRAGVTNLKPLEVRSAIGVHPVQGTNGPALLVHAPGEMVFPATSTTTLTGSCGISAAAYEVNGHTDGARFVIAAVDAQGEETILWDRTLAPLNNPDDRGAQPFSIRAPEGTVRMMLRTEPGPANNTDWDWTWWSRLRFAEPD